MSLPFGTGGFSVETRGYAELSDATLHASPHHQPVPRLVNKKRTGNIGERGCAHENSDLLAAHETQALNQLVSIARRSEGVLFRRHRF